MAIRLLTEGDFFGEIGLIYKNRNRTASVVSRNYNTMARISYVQYRELVNEYPEFQKLLKASFLSYGDVV
jgi:CRP-like cAMP-binding protein